MAKVKKFQKDSAKYTNGIKDIYNPEGNSYEKQNEEKLSRIQKLLPVLMQYASFWRSYPDLFIDFITPKDSSFKLFFYQRLFLRIAIRYRYVFMTFPRAFSKSFLSILILFLKCIFYPGIKIFISAGGKEQASNIAKEKVEELFELFPLLEKEVKRYQTSKDYVKLIFHNGSKLDIVAVQNSSRGGRRHCGLLEEAILIDGKLLNEVIIPLMNVNRRARNGDVDENEIHKHQIYVTTAGYKNTFAYQKLIQVLVWMITRGNAFVLGGDYKIPVMHKLLDKDFIEELKEDGTYNPMSFAREYESNWTGTSEDAFFDSEFIDRNRILTESEYEPETGRKRKVEYVIATDVARVQGKKNADTVALVIKIIPRANGTYIKHIVNMFVFNGEHFENQSIKLKKIVFKYKARMLAIDANGLGVGLVDYLVKENADEVTGEIFPPFSVTNDSDYDKYKTSKSLPLLYNIKSTPANTTHIHVNCLSQISSDKVKFLTDEITSKAKLLSTKKGQKLTPEEVAKHLVPFILTTIMKEEMMNLKKKPEGKGVQLERINTRMGKDKFSALEYGLWYIKSLEDKNIKKDVNVDGKKFCMIKKPKYRKYH